MTPEEYARLARLEERDILDRARLDRMEEKLDQLLTVADRGAGAWYAILKIGGLVVAVVGVAVGLVTLFEKLLALLTKH